MQCPCSKVGTVKVCFLTGLWVQQVSLSIGPSSTLPLGPVQAGPAGRRMEVVRHRPRAPHPRRYLILILLQELSAARGISAHILIRPEVSFVEALLGASRTCGLVLLCIGTDAFPLVRSASRELYFIFARLVDQAFADRHRLARIVFP